MKSLFALLVAILLSPINHSWANTDIIISKPKIIKANNIKLWTESFGDEHNPPILLIIGAGAQSILWPDKFCQKLADQGFYVIRYDHRDTGESSKINFKKHPYTVMDLTKDAVAVLDKYKINQANIVGFSMGGQIAQFMAAYYPSRVLSLTLIGTSTSFKEGFDAFAGVAPKEDALSAPLPYYVEWATRKVDYKKQTRSQKIKDFIHSWKLLNGDKTPFDEKLYTLIAERSFARSKLDNPYFHHSKAMQASFAEHEKAPSLITAPTLIIHGTEDPVFGVDHAEALHDAISDSKLEIIEGMGHALNTHFYDQIVGLIKERAQKE